MAHLPNLPLFISRALCWNTYQFTSIHPVTGFNNRLWRAEIPHKPRFKSCKVVHGLWAPLKLVEKILGKIVINSLAKGMKARREQRDERGGLDGVTLLHPIQNLNVPRAGQTNNRISAACIGKARHRSSGSKQQ